jgi:hypothetical protein
LGKKLRAKTQERPARVAEETPPAEGGGRRARLLAVIGGVVIVCVIVGGLAAALLRGGGGASENPTLKAAIVDQLSAKTPNQSFVDDTTATLEDAGYAVDYYPGESVTVQAYRDLATHGYDLIIVRAHSAVPNKDLTLPTNVDPAIVSRVMGEIGDDVLLFTSERYNPDNYLDDQRGLRLFPVVYAGEPMSDIYFAVATGFVTSNMKGGFDGTTIVLMGCSSLSTEKTAAAFVDRGASSVIGWSDTVSPEHTDAATERLVSYLAKDGLSPAEAVDRVNAELGPDPSYGAVMKAYPAAE